MFIKNSKNTLKKKILNKLKKFKCVMVLMLFFEKSILLFLKKKKFLKFFFVKNFKLKI